jgi:phosphate-selective porin
VETTSVKKTVTIVNAVLAATVVIPVARAADEVEEKPKLSGFVQADYRLGDGNGETVQGYGEQEFNLRRARLAISGKVNERVGYGVIVQGDNTGGTLFRDMFATLNFDPKAKLTVGQFKYEFDIEGREASPDRPFMDRGTIVNVAGGGVSGDFRDKGAQLSGMLMGLGGMSSGYAVGIWQGNGGTTTVSDANGGTTSGSPSAADPSSGGNNSFMYTANLFLVPMKCPGKTTKASRAPMK